MTDISRDATHSAGVGQEVRANGLDITASGSRKLANSLEILVGGPASRESWQGQVDLRNRHFEVIWGSR